MCGIKLRNRQRYISHSSNHLRMRSHEIEKHEERKDIKDDNEIPADEVIHGISTNLYSAYFKRLCDENGMSSLPSLFNLNRSGLIPHATRRV
jgi:hypothetical protein